MEISNLEETELKLLLDDLQKTDDISGLSEKYDVSIPQWLSIKYRCVSCAKETPNRIQTISIKTANKTLTCPFCRKVSRMFKINTEKNIIDLNNKDLM